MANSMILLRVDDSQNQRHGGIRQYRHFTLYVNGVIVDHFRDDDQSHGYHSGPYLDRYISEFISLWEKALDCKCVRAERKGRIKLIPERLMPEVR